MNLSLLNVLRILIVVLLPFILFLGGNCNVIYVSTLSNNTTNECGNASDPCGSIQSAVNRAVNGDLILLLDDGIYNNTNVTVSPNMPCISFAGNSSTTTWRCHYNNYSLNVLPGALIYSENSMIYKCSAPISIRNITFKDCTAWNLNALSGGGAINIQYQEYDVIVENCKFFNCSTGYVENTGGALSVSSPSLTIINCEFKNCSVSGEFGQGGAVYYSNDEGALIIEGTKFINNSIYGSPGGQLYGGAVCVYSPILLLSNCSFIDNQILSSFNDDTLGGGALYYEIYIVVKEITAIIDNCVFWGNKIIGYPAVIGGAIFTNMYTLGNLTIANTMFKENYVIGTGLTISGTAYGGAVSIEGVVELHMNNVTLSNNQAIGGHSNKGELAQAAQGGALFVNGMERGYFSHIYASNNIAIGGTSNDSQAKQSYGGAFFIQGAQIDMDDIVIINNTCMGGRGLTSGGIASGILTIQIVAAIDNWNVSMNRLLIESNQIIGGDAEIGAGGESYGIIDIQVIPDHLNFNKGNINISSTILKYNRIYSGSSIIGGAGGGILRLNNKIHTNVSVSISDTFVDSNQVISNIKTEYGSSILGGAIQIHNVLCYFSKLNISNGIGQNINGNAGGAALFANNCEINWVDSEIKNCTIISRHGGFGGAIYLHRTILTMQNVNLMGSSVTDLSTINIGAFDKWISSHSWIHEDTTKGSSQGGAFYAVDSRIYLYDCSVEENSADYGGFAFLNNTNLLIDASVFSKNRANIAGGGIIVSDGSCGNISDSILKENQARFGGFGFVNASGALILANCTIINNYAEIGGGALMMINGVGSMNQLNLVGSNCSFNQAVLGGVMFFEGNPGTPSAVIMDNAFANNTASEGGGVFFINSDKADCSWTSVKTSNYFTKNFAAYGDILSTPLGSIGLIATNSSVITVWPGTTFSILVGVFDQCSQLVKHREDILVRFSVDKNIFQTDVSGNNLVADERGWYMLNGFVKSSFGTSTFANFTLHPPFSDIPPLQVQISIQPCPTGYWFDVTDLVCLECVPGTYSLQSCNGSRGSTCCESCPQQVDISGQCMSFLPTVIATQQKLFFEINAGYWPENLGDETDTLVNPDTILVCPAGSRSCKSFNCTAQLSLGDWSMNCSNSECFSSDIQPYIGCCYSNNGFYDRLCSRCLCTDSSTCWYQSSYAYCSQCKQSQEIVLVIWVIVLCLSLGVYAVFPESSLILFVIEVIATGFLMLLGVADVAEMSIAIVLLLLGLVSGKHLAHGVVSTFIFFSQSLSIIPEQAWPDAISSPFRTVWDFRFLPISCLSPSLSTPVWNLVMDVTLPFIFIAVVIVMMVVTFLLSRLNLVQRLKKRIVDLIGMLRVQRPTQTKQAEPVLQNGSEFDDSFRLVSFSNIPHNHDEDNKIYEYEKKHLKLSMSASNKFGYQVLTAVLFLVEYFYFKIASAVLGVLQPCEEGYMANYLWIPCKMQDSDYLAMIIISIVVLIMYVCGFYVIVAVMLFWKRQEIKAKDIGTSLWLGVYYDHFSLKVFWFELVLLGRRLALSVITSSIPNENSLQSNMALMVFLLSAVLVSFLSPYHHRFENHVDVFGSCLLAWSYGVGSLVELDLASTGATQYMVFISNISFILLLLFLMVFSGGKSVILKMWNAGMGLKRKWLSQDNAEKEPLLHLENETEEPAPVQDESEYVAEEIIACSKLNQNDGVTNY